MLSFLFEHYDPHHDALLTPEGDRLTFADLAGAIRRASTALHGAGARPGCVVVVDASPPASALVAMLATLETGASLMPLDTRSGALGRQELVQRARPLLHVTGATLEGAIAIEEPCKDPRKVSADVGLLLFTSGSSGMPKGVLLGREGLKANIEAILTYLPVREHSRTALVLPLSYSYALVGQAMVTLRVGGTLLMLAEPGFPTAQVESMRSLGATGLSAVPTSLRRLCDVAMELSEDDRPPLGYIASAGAPLDATTRDRLREAFPTARRFNQYGLTEASPRVTACSDQDEAFHKGSVGRSLPGLDVRAIAPDGSPLPPGEVGELLIQGPSVMRGYLDDSEATAAVLGPEGLRSGDWGRVESEGYVYVEGRRDGLVKVAGERVSLEEVANVVRAAEGVNEAAVVAVPDSTLGHHLVAFVSGTSGAVAAARAHARDRLPAAKRPRRFVALERLPRNERDKIDLAALARHAAALD